MAMNGSKFYLEDTTVKSYYFTDKSLTKKLAKNINSAINEIIAESQNVGNTGSTNSSIGNSANKDFENFNLHEVLDEKLTLSYFIKRIVKYTKVNLSTIILALIYIDRLCDKASLILTENNIFRLFLTSVYIAMKYNEDILHSDKSLSLVFGVEIEELCELEQDFIAKLDFSLYVDEKTFKFYDEFLFDMEI